MCVYVAKPVAVELHCHATALFAYAKTKTQISFPVISKLISAFVIATQIVQSLYFLYTKFQASSHLVWFVLDLVGNQKTGFLRMRLIQSYHLLHVVESCHIKVKNLLFRFHLKPVGSAKLVSIGLTLKVEV